MDGRHSRAGWRASRRVCQMQEIEEIEPDAALLRLAQVLREGGYRFTTVSPATHALVNSRPGNELATDLRGIFGWSRPFKADILPPPLFALMLSADVAVRHGGNWHSLVRLSTLHRRLFIHSAYPTVDADAVFFGPDTYRFTTALTRHLETRTSPVRRAVDIGCGTGAGAIVLALERPGAEVLAVDINDAALWLTAINAALADTPNVMPHRSNLLSAVDGQFDLIIANPPYLLDCTERTYRHGGGGLGEGLSLAITRVAMDRLAPGGTLLLYTGAAIANGVDHIHEAIRARLRDANVEWEYREIDPDIFGDSLLEPAYVGADRIAAVLATVTKSS
jgi:methylase of polypeptide subunit release factors